MAHPDPRTIRRALGVLERLPAEAQADLAERIIDRLDAAEPDLDLEEEHDACPAEDVPIPGHLGAGDANDAEPDDDDEDNCDAEENGDAELTEDDPHFPTLRPERDGFVTVHRRKNKFVMVTTRGGRLVRVQTVIMERPR